MRKKLIHPHGVNPGIIGKQCKCAGVMELVKYSWSKFQREIDYACTKCNRRQSVVCADEHRFAPEGL
jgi:hypothetical protein